MKTEARTKDRATDNRRTKIDSENSIASINLLAAIADNRGGRAADKTADKTAIANRTSASKANRGATASNTATNRRPPCSPTQASRKNAGNSADAAAKRPGLEKTATTKTSAVSEARCKNTAANGADTRINAGTANAAGKTPPTKADTLNRKSRKADFAI